MPEGRYDLGKQLVLDRLQPLMKTLDAVSGDDRNGTLGDHGTVVHELIDEMNRDAGLVDTCVERLFDGVGTGERG